ncbi:LTA synthase family protein [Paenibacillus sp. CC-CFT747]|nr:LTA synthase family protein [Paenibacillus sp. CC-CFT747]
MDPFPQFGGTTANVEFEVLTGNSVRFLPDSTVAYISHVNRPVDSLASIYSRKGYTATAVNPFYNWFFNSRNVYRHLGFSRFVPSEYMDQEFHGPFLKDSQVMDTIIRATEESPGPDFVFANTMENHGPYKDKFYRTEIEVSGEVSEESLAILRNYAEGERAFDQALKKLTDHYRESAEPTVILCFGDHMAQLGNAYKVYRDTGYITGAEDPSYMEKMHYTPFVIWSNAAAPGKDSLRMNASFLGVYLLHYLGTPGTYYTDYLYELYRRLPLFAPARCERIIRSTKRSCSITGGCKTIFCTALKRATE